MSHFQGTEWVNLMSGYETDFEQGDRAKTQISSLFHKLNKTLEKKSALFWHIKTLNRYKEDKINPLGLRIQIFPNLDQISAECKSEWEANLNACSQEMMAILTREYNKQMVSLDKEIDNIDTSLRPFMQHTLYSDLQANLRSCLSTYNRNVLQKKESKFWRDHAAFSEGRAYKWNNKSQTNFQKNKQYVTQQQSKQNTNVLKPKKDLASNQNSKTPKERGKFKRSRNNKGSPEQERKKRTMEATLEPNLGVHTGEVEYAGPKSDITNIAVNEIDSPSNITVTKIYPNPSLGCQKSSSQNPLNQAQGFSPSQTNRGAGNLDAFVTRIPMNPSA